MVFPRPGVRSALLWSAVPALLWSAALPGAAQQWTAPTPEELSMTSIPQVPGAPAVILYNEQITDDSLHMESHYVRLKVLSDGGKDYANVELPFFSDKAGLNVDSVSGRTIQPDGTIVPFTGKPYDKLIEKGKDYKYKAKVFTLPAVQVGSILEYRYKLHNDDNYFRAPDWYVQQDVYIRKGFYQWFPTDKDLVDEEDGGQLTSTVAWTPLLPEGAVVKQEQVGRRNQLVLRIDDVPPLPEETASPPLRGLSYRVLFYYTPYRTMPEFWQKRGKSWSKRADKFVGPGSGVRAAAKEATASDTTELAKAKHLYAAVMQLENTDYTREQTVSELHASGLKPAASADDVLAQKRGSGDQLAELYVGLCRAAGLKAYVMGVANRRQHIFIPAYLNLRQLEDLIAVVMVDGKEMYFDPGTRYTAFGQLAWQHMMSSGLRQTEKGVELGQTPPELNTANTTKRIADLALDDQGVASGTVTLTYTGNEARDWRERALASDDTELNKQLRSSLEDMMPGGMDVRVTNVTGLADYDQPLKVTYAVKGPVGAVTGRRLLVPASLFETNSKPRFTLSKRTLGIDLHFPSTVQDAVRLKLPATMKIESAPVPDKQALEKSAAYSTSSTQAGNAITLYRNLLQGQTFYRVDDYPAFKSFQEKVMAADQGALVLTHADAPAAAAAGQAANQAPSKP